MKAVTHPIIEAHQPTNLSCGQTCLCMLLSFFEDSISAEDVLKDIPMLTTDDDKEWGTFGIDLAHWCMKRGYSAATYTFDSQIVRLPWAKLSPAEIIGELEALRETYVFPSLGKNLTRSFIDAYIRYLSDGGVLVIKPFLELSLLYELLQEGPFIALVTYNVLYGTAGGSAATHFVVVYGNDEEGNFLIADPWKDNGRKIIEPERLTSGIMSAQMTCENAVFRISKDR